jgi:pimeloyl-ACP methyl ester carboxylesterase
MASDVRALTDQAGFGRFHLVGHSMGGAIAQEIALGDQERVITLTLEDTGLNPASFRSEELARYSVERNRIAEEEGMAALAARPSPFPRSAFMTEEREAEERERLARMSVDGFLGAAAAMGAWPGTSDRLRGLTVPTLVIYGELDMPWLVKSSLRIAELVPGARLVCIPQAAHGPQYERPELFNAALRSHLERHKT